ncbi:type II toxin-antitoxin system Phd/YefM family antitoxin [Candidatus Parcubacteria bacterium]|nr:type II toxin-antitoxin system Phd/YefM family antitoxin [Candidatus Parcubacteria bacterium]
MNSRNTLSVTEARKKIFNIADDVQKGSNYYFLTERGRAKAVIMSADEFDSWQETMEVTRNFPNLKNDTKEAQKNYKSGNYIILEKLLAKEGFVLVDKGKKEYVQNSNTKKRAKRFKKN